LRANEAENLAGNFFHKVVVGLLGREECNVALELGAHGFEAFDLKLQQSRSLDQPGPRLEAVPAIDGMMDEVGRQTQAEKQNRDLPWPRASIMIFWLTQHFGYAAQSWWTRAL
jgi:hypothetical protein